MYHFEIINICKSAQIS